VGCGANFRLAAENRWSHAFLASFSFIFLSFSSEVVRGGQNVAAQLASIQIKYEILFRQ
jgi:hypothetical protein